MRHLILLALLALTTTSAMASRGRLIREIYENISRGHFGRVPVDVAQGMRATSSWAEIFSLMRPNNVTIKLHKVGFENPALHVEFQTRHITGWDGGIPASVQGEVAAAATTQRRFVRYMNALLRGNGLADNEFRILRTDYTLWNNARPRTPDAVKTTGFLIPENSLDKLDIGEIERMVADLARL